MQPTVLIVEDEATLRETLEYNLQRQGYDVLVAEDGREALRLARAARPALILLDVMLPGIDGFEVCRILRREMSTPILMLTAKDEEVDKVVGLEVGADDYITKPFSMRELMARVKAQLRRVRLTREEVESSAPIAAAQQSVLRFDNLMLDSDRREVRLDGQVLHLKPKEYDLLLFLARHRGMALSRELILERVWGWTNDTSRTIDVHIRWLREKIEPQPSNPQRIITVRGIGYRFEG